MRLRRLVKVWLVLFFIVCLFNSGAVLWFRWYGADAFFAFLLPFLHCGAAVVVFIFYHVFSFVIRGVWPGEGGERGGVDHTNGEAETGEAGDVKAPLTVRVQLGCVVVYIALFVLATSLGMPMFRPIWLFGGFATAGLVAPLAVYMAFVGTMRVVRGKEAVASFARKEAVRMAHYRSRRRMRRPGRILRRRNERSEYLRVAESTTVLATLTGGAFLITLLVWLFSAVLVVVGIRLHCGG